MRPGLKVEKLNGGLFRREATDDMITAVVMNAVSTSKMELGKIYTFLNISEVEELEITSEYDDQNEILVYHRLQRLFLRNPSITINCMFVEQDVTLTEMADKNQPYLANLLRKKGNNVQAMIARNPLPSYTPTITDGLDEDSINAVYKAQELVDFEFSRDRYIDVFVEGRSFTGTPSAALNLRKLTNVCPDVSLVIMADYEISRKKDIYKNYAAVEDFTGMISKAAVSQNAGELIEGFNLTDSSNKAFIKAGLSGGQPIEDYSEEALDMLDEKGYVFAAPVSGLAGFWINDTHTCDAITSDYAYVENNRTIKKAIKLTRTALLPRVKSRFYVDESTGQLRGEDIKELEGLSKEAMRPILISGDISGGIDAYINPEQNLLATSELIVNITFIPVAIGRKITLRIGFKNPLNSN